MGNVNEIAAVKRWIYRCLGYGVTVAQQSLNLLVKVRILVPQFKSPSDPEGLFFG